MVRPELQTGDPYSSMGTIDDLNSVVNSYLLKPRWRRDLIIDSLVDALVTMKLTWSSLVRWWLKITPSSRVEDSFSTWEFCRENCQFWLTFDLVKSTTTTWVFLALSFILMLSAATGASCRTIEVMRFSPFVSIAAVVASSTNPNTSRFVRDSCCRRWRNKHQNEGQ